MVSLRRHLDPLSPPTLGSPKGSLQTCLLLPQAMQRAKDAIPHSDPMSPLAGFSFPSMEVNRLRNKRCCFYKALRTHKALAPTPPPANRQETECP